MTRLQLWRPPGEKAERERERERERVRERAREGERDSEKKREKKRGRESGRERERKRERERALTFALCTVIPCLEMVGIDHPDALPARNYSTYRGTSPIIKRPLSLGPP
jgi:hypothetical protein